MFEDLIIDDKISDKDQRIRDLKNLFPEYIDLMKEAKEHILDLRKSKEEYFTDAEIFARVIKKIIDDSDNGVTVEKALEIEEQATKEYEESKQP